MYARSLPRQVRADGRQRGEDRAHDQHEPTDEGERGPQDASERFRCDGRRDRDEEETDDQLDDRSEERSVLRRRDHLRVGDHEAHHDRRDETGVVVHRVTHGRDRDHGGDRRLGGQYAGHAQLVEEQPQHHRADQPTEDPDADADGEVEHGALHSLVLAARQRMEHERPDDGADRIDRRALPAEDRAHPTTGASPFEQWYHDGRSGHDEDRTEQDRDAGREVEQEEHECDGPCPGDRHTPQDQPANDVLAVTLEVPDPQVECAVEQDHPDGQRDHRRELVSHQLVRIDGLGQRPCEEARAEEQDDRRHARPAWPRSDTRRRGRARAQGR